MADDITIRVGVDGKAVEPALKQVEKSAEAAGKNVGKKFSEPAKAGLDKLRISAASLVDDLQSRFMSFFAISSLIDRGIGFATQSFQELSKVGEQASKLGIDPQDFQRIQYAAEQTGTSVEKLQVAFRNMRTAVKDAKNGNEDAIKVMQSLGYTQEQIASGNISSMDMFRRLAGAIGAASSEQEKFSAVSAVVGARTAQDIIPLLSSPRFMQILSEAPVNTKADIERADRQADYATKKTRQAKVLTGMAVTNAPGAAVLATGIAPLIKTAGILMDRLENGPTQASPLQGDAAKAAAAGLAGIGAQKEATPAGRLPSVVSSLAAIGGGGNVYAGGLGADEMATLATRTANASERSANALEKLANSPRGTGSGGIVSGE